MSTTSPASCHDAAANAQADSAAVLEQLAAGLPLDPALVERVRARAAQITAEMERRHGMVDDETFHSLLDDEA
jgi:hypothetical protein